MVNERYRLFSVVKRRRGQPVANRREPYAQYLPQKKVFLAGCDPHHPHCRAVAASSKLILCVAMNSMNSAVDSSFGNRFDRLLRTQTPWCQCEHRDQYCQGASSCWRIATFEIEIFYHCRSNFPRQSAMTTEATTVTTPGSMKL